MSQRRSSLRGVVVNAQDQVSFAQLHFTIEFKVAMEI